MVGAPAEHEDPLEPGNSSGTAECTDGTDEEDVAANQAFAVWLSLHESVVSGVIRGHELPDLGLTARQKSSLREEVDERSHLPRKSAS